MVMLRVVLLSRLRVSRRLYSEGVPVEHHDPLVALENLVGLGLV